MISRRFLRAFAAPALTLFAVALTPQSAEAQRQRNCLCGRPPNESAYAGLFAPDFTPVDASASFSPAALHGAKLALIPSANFSEYSRRWVHWYEEGGQENNWAYNLLGFDRDTMRSQEHNSDPRQYADRLVALVEPYVGEVIVATDFQNARSQGATYYLVVDSWLGTSRWGEQMLAWSSASLFDGDLNRVFFAEGSHEARRGGGGLGESVVEADAAAQVAAIQGATNPVLTALQTRLGPPPVAAP